ncbi:DUF676-domain-containing protein [Tricholoma matsutake]|nr:DUF676-domain-containing protein [Tricholoma matsutake 945]
MSSPHVHLLVLIHGMWGSPNHCAELSRIVRETHSKPSADGVMLEVLIPKANKSRLTDDGIDWCAERVAMEVTNKIQELESNGRKITRFSVTGYSLGGLVGRYLICILYQQGFFETIAPVNFHSIATPHLGVPRLPTLVSTVVSSCAPRLMRTGEQLYCVDRWGSTGKPLLQVMANRERIFYQALALFPYITFYANAINDRTVPYITAAIDIEDPFSDHETSGIEVEFNGKYSPMINSYILPDVPPPPPSKPIVLSPNWFHYHLEKQGFFMPRILQARYPFNFVVFALLPAIIPLAICTLLIYLPFGTYNSRARIRLLEKDVNSRKLIGVFAELEKTMVDIIDHPGASLSHSTPTEAPQQRSILTPLQYQIAASLNRLPINKRLAFIKNVTNSHAVIVCQNVKRFETDRAGEGVVQHWAASFSL